MFEFYRSVFGGEFDTIMTFREGPPDMGIAEAEQDRIMHVSLPIGSEELAEAMSPWKTYCIEQFGPDRCMLESNFPPDKVSFSYNVMYNAFKRIYQGYSSSERAAMLHDTAARVYRLEV